MTFIRWIASIGAAMLIGLWVTPVKAGYVVDLTQQGSDVVATGSGPIDLTGLTFFVSTSAAAALAAASGNVLIGTGPPSGTADFYFGLTGPQNFGSGGTTFASSGGGDFVGITASGGRDLLAVPDGYVSDSPIADIATYDSQTFSSLGATPGTYKWTWGSGANQNFTLVIGAAVPEPSTWVLMLLGFAGLGFLGYQSAGRRLRSAPRLG